MLAAAARTPLPSAVCRGAIEANVAQVRHLTAESHQHVAYGDVAVMQAPARVHVVERRPHLLLSPLNCMRSGAAPPLPCRAPNHSLSSQNSLWSLSRLIWRVLARPLGFISAAPCGTPACAASSAPAGTLPSSTSPSSTRCSGSARRRRTVRTPAARAASPARQRIAWPAPRSRRHGPSCWLL